MWKETVVYAQESAPGGGADAPSAFPGSFLFMFLIIGIFYFLLIRPNTKRDRERKEMLSSLAKGRKVVTSGGVCGTIVGISDKTVVLKVSDDPVTKIEFMRGAVSQIAPDESESDAEESK